MTLKSPDNGAGRLDAQTRELAARVEVGVLEAPGERKVATGDLDRDPDGLEAYREADDDGAGEAVRLEIGFVDGVLGRARRIVRRGSSPACRRC